jgi:hypothetical protein
MQFEPQVNFPEPKAAPAQAGQQQRRKPSEKKFEDFLRDHFLQIKSERDKVRKLVEMAVTMHRRYRGLTLSDLCGRYGARRSTDGRWLDYDADLDGEIHPINIVQPAVRANVNACLQSNPDVKVEAASQSAKNKNIAMRWQRVADYFYDKDWTEDRRQLVFDAVQKEGCILIEITKERDSYQDAAQVSEQPGGIAKWKCPSCGMSGIAQTGPELTEGMGEIPCPHCKQSASAVATAASSYSMGETQIPEYEIGHKHISMFNFAIDRYGAKLRGINGAKWLAVSDLKDKVELETDYPHLQFTANKNWSYQAQCDYALANSDWRYLTYGAQQDRYIVLEFLKLEVTDVYLHECAYSNYVFPEPYQFVNAKGKVIIDAQQGQTIEEALTATHGFDPDGLMYRWEGERLLEICDPTETETNFRKKFGDIHWLRDSSSFLSSPYYSIIHIQDDITLLNTMNHNIIARNAVIPTYYDSMVFEQADFNKEYIGSKNAALLPDRDLNKAVVQLPVPTPSPYLGQQLQFLWEIKDTVSQVTPAQRGETQPGQPYAAQRQQLEQSYGLLTSCLKSFAQCLIDTFKKKAAMAADCWTLEQFQAVGSAFGEAWTDDDVQEMCEIDFQKDLRVYYEIGSEMPQSNLDRHMKFYEGLTQLLPLVAAFPELLGGDKITKILAKIDEYSEFDFDLTGLEVNDLIAQKRYNELVELCEQFGELPFEAVEAAKNQVVAVTPVQIDPATGQPTGGQQITQMDLMTEQLFYSSTIRFSKYEDLNQQQAFFTEQLRAEIGKTKPNYLLIELLTTLLGMMEQAINAVKMQMITSSPEYQLAQNEAAKEDANNKANAQREDANKHAERKAKADEGDKQFARGLITQGSQNEHDLEKTKIQAASKAPPQGAGSKK